MLSSIGSEATADKQDASPCNNQGSSFTDQLIAANLGLHFSSESDPADLPEGPDLPTMAQATEQTVEKTASRVKRLPEIKGLSKKRDDDDETDRQVHRLIRETHASLPIQVAKPKSFAALTAVKQANKLQLLKRRLTPEQYNLLRKRPQLTADDGVGRDGDLLRVIGNSRKLGMREGCAGVAIPKGKPASIDRLNRDLDAKIVSQGRMHEHIKQAICKKRKRIARSKQVEDEAEKVARAPFGYDPVKAIQREREKPDEEDADPLLYPEENSSGGLLREENLDPLMYPDEEKDGPTGKDDFIEEDVCEDSLVSHESPSDRKESDGEHAVDAAEKRHESQPRSLKSLFIDDEAESGDDDDEEDGRSGRRAKDSEWYDEEQYAKDVAEFVTDSDASEGDLAAIHRSISMADDKRAIDTIMNKLGVMEGEEASWMQSMHRGLYGGGVHGQDFHRGSKQAIEPDAEDRERVERLKRLGFTRTRTIQPADNEFLFPDEHRPPSSALPSSEPETSARPSELDSEGDDVEPEEEDCEIPSDDDVNRLYYTPEEDGNSQVQDLSAASRARKDAFFGRQPSRANKAAPKGDPALCRQMAFKPKAPAAVPQ